MLAQLNGHCNERKCFAHHNKNLCGQNCYHVVNKPAWKQLHWTGLYVIPETERSWMALHRVPTEIQKHNSMIFHDHRGNFHD